MRGLNLFKQILVPTFFDQLIAFSLNMLILLVSVSSLMPEKIQSWYFNTAHPLVSCLTKLDEFNDYMGRCK